MTKKNDYLSDGYHKIRDDVMHRSGIGSTHEMNSVVTGIFFPSYCIKLNEDGIN